MNISSKIRLRQDSSANWTAVNPVLDIGEPAFEVDTGKLKLGNGNSNYIDLPYLESEGSKWFVQNSIPTEMKENDLWLVSESFDSYNSGDVYEYVDSNWKYKSNIQGKSGVDGKDTLVYTEIYDNGEEPDYGMRYTVNKSNFNREANLGEYFNLTFEHHSMVPNVYSCICKVTGFPDRDSVQFDIRSFIRINGLNIITLPEGNIDHQPDTYEELPVYIDILHISPIRGQSACWVLINSTNDEKYLTTGTFTDVTDRRADYLILSVQSLTSSGSSSTVETIENTTFNNEVISKIMKCKKFDIKFTNNIIFGCKALTIHENTSGFSNFEGYVITDPFTTFTFYRSIEMEPPAVTYLQDTFTAEGLINNNNDTLYKLTVTRNNNISFHYYSTGFDNDNTSFSTIWGNTTLDISTAIQKITLYY